MLSPAEWKLVAVIATSFCAFRLILKQTFARNALVFALALVTGFLVQLPLGRQLNLYTGNITHYIGYVSVAVILTWGIGLTSIYAVHAWVAERLRAGSSAGLFLCSSLPLIVVIEFIGSNVIRMKLHNYREYASLMPALNSMHAPAWLYAYYGAVAVAFYFLLKALGLLIPGEAERRVERPAVTALVVLLALTSPLGAEPVRVAAPADRAFERIYNFDFAGAHAILDAARADDPADPLPHAVRAAALLFSEFHRLRVLELDFFADDDTLTDRKRLKPDAAAKARLFAATATARRLSQARLRVDGNDRGALFALCMAAGLETEYSSLVEKSYLRSYSLSKETQKYARRLLAMNPPVHDAYLTVATTEYVVSNLNPFFRFFVNFENIEGSKTKAVENLQRVIQGGRFYPPFARILLAVVHLREKRPDQALSVLRELERDFPENPLIHREAALAAEKVARLR